MTGTVTVMTTIGRILLPGSGTNVTGFTALIHPDHITSVAVGAVVVADTNDGAITGIVTDLSTIGTDNDAILAANTVNVDMNSLVTESRDALVATIQTFHSPALRPVRSGTIRHACADDITILTGANDMTTAIPAGVVQLADGTYAPIHLDADELLGPLAAHLIVGGRSGAAAKTSYVSVLLAATMSAMAREGKRGAALLFNVKGPDLLTLDYPAPVGSLTDTDKAMYEALQTPVQPFDDVTVYAPSLPGGNGTRSAREDTVGVQWGLRDIWPYLRYLDSRFSDNDSAYALTEDLYANKVDVPSARITCLGDLIGFLENELAEADAENASDIWRGHHVATARKILRTFRSLPAATNGLVALQRVPAGQADIPVTFRDGQTVVVDVAELSPRVQAAVIARTCDQLLKSASRDGLGVEHLIVFADELNVFAPNTAGDIPRHVKDILGKVAATGRYAGVTLWGAAQFPSQIAGQIRDNASTTVLGAIADTELDSPAYGKLPAGVREQMVTAARGTMMMRAANLRSWTPIRFPRPAWSTGQHSSDRALRATPTNRDALDVSDASYRNLTEGVDGDVAEHVIAAAGGDLDQAADALEALRDPDMRRIAGEPASSYDPTNPWAIVDDPPAKQETPSTTRP